MARISNRITSGVSTILHSLIVPVFVLVFMTYYKPLGIYELLSMENVTFGFNVTMIFCIVLVTVSITRAWLYLLGKFKKLPVSVYTMWCIGETLIASLFAAMYVALISPEQISYFETAGSTFISLLVTTIYPYGFLWLGLELYAKHNDDIKPVDESSLIRFYDEYKKLRLVLASEAIIFIKSEDNYVQIHYMDQGRTKKFILRSTMRALEDTLAKHGLVRCHRSFFINPSFIKIVHRDSAGLIVAELNQDGYESIPISRKFQDAIMKLL